MQTFELSAEEIETLREVLERDLAELEVELFHTDSHDFKEMLKHRREILNHLQTKLSQTSVPA